MTDPRYDIPERDAEPLDSDYQDWRREQEMERGDYEYERRGDR